MKLLLLFLVIIGLVSGALIGMNVHELSKENLDKGDKAISVTNIVIGSVLFFIGLGLLFFLDRTRGSVVVVPTRAPKEMPEMPSVQTKPSVKTYDEVIVPEDLKLSSI